MKNIKRLLVALLFTLILAISTFASAGEIGNPADGTPVTTDPIVQPMMVEEHRCSWFEELLKYILSIF
jgi:hypothetical protein